jgi:HlyD family secretion protein
MPAETYIETGNRSLLSYVTKPLRDQFMRAFRDN